MGMTDIFKNTLDTAEGIFKRNTDPHNEYKFGNRYEEEDYVLEVKVIRKRKI